MASNKTVQPAKAQAVQEPAHARENGAGIPHPDRKRVSIQAALEQALKLFNAGRLPMALKICNQILEAQPRNAVAHNLAGVIMNARGDAAAGVKALQRAIRYDPGNAVYHSNLGEIERQRGKRDLAAAALKEAVALAPRSAQAHNNLGILHFDMREFEKAVECYQTAINLNASYPEAYNNLGNALRALDRNDEAADNYQRALLLRENYPEAYNNLAAVLRDRDQIAEAEHAYRKAFSLRPNYLEAYNNLAAMLIEHEREDDALKVLGEALNVDGKHVPTLLQVARTQLHKGNVSQAEQAVRLALKYDAEKPEGYVVLGQVLHDTDRFVEALGAYEKALALNSDLAEAHNYYGICLKSTGRLDEAKAAFVKSLELNPRAIGVYSNIADLEKFTADHPILAKMQELVAEAEDPMSDHFMSLHFALGKAYDDSGEYEKAFSHFKTGATMKRAKLDYDEAATFAFFDRIKEVFSRDFLASRPSEGNPSTAPLFIIGMPRSGSTLVEQILSSHPDVFGAGEIKVFSRQLHGLRSRFPALPKYPDIALKMNDAQYRIVADGYLAAVSQLAPKALKITDKLLTNYYFAGMLHIMFPNARFIHTKRNPVDTCLSGFTKLFKDDMPHSYDLGELGRYYRKYESLMAHWESVLPEGVLKTVAYENVVGDLDTAAREIVEFAGLPWNDACLAFHKSERPVKTASVVQVRKPVYSSSVERWRRYGSDMNPLLNALGMDEMQNQEVV